ncbi:MAG TPA: hypothetical protein VF062_22345 [Candidatus Limnocylindrales bacterium]
MSVDLVKSVTAARSLGRFVTFASGVSVRITNVQTAAGHRDRVTLSAQTPHGALIVRTLDSDVVLPLATTSVVA